MYYTSWISHGVNAILLLALIVAGFGVASASEPTIVISSWQSQPEVLMPGGSAMITVILTNTAQKASITTTAADQESGQSVTTTSEVNAYISDVDLFGNGLLVDSGDYRRIGEIGPGQSIPLTFLVRAPDHTGIFFPELHIATEGGRSLKYPIPVNVNDNRFIQKNPALQIEKRLPSNVTPGDDASGSLILKNIGETAASEIIGNISPKDSGLSLRSPQTFHIRTLGPGDKETVDLDIMTSKNAEEGIKSLVCHITYRSAAGTLHEQNEMIPIRLTGSPELAIATVTSDPVRIVEGNPFSLIVRIENTGTGDADGVRAKIETPINGTKEAFVGKIEPDNDAPAIFYLQNPPSGDMRIAVTFWEQDSPEDAISDTISINVGSKGALPVIPVIIILILLGAGGYLIQYRRAGKR